MDNLPIISAGVHSIVHTLCKDVTLANATTAMNGVTAATVALDNAQGLGA